ncbi:MAG: M28 family peptidase [Planctomycetota bacterium]
MDESLDELGAVATMQAFLRAPDPNLAEKFLEATAQDLAMYAKLIGPYPYAKFALVENFWETGYGMPSFTLLGPQVIRFPFLLTSSYPHEILHNWWGNSVFVDYATGNWCEGLTAYLADHLFKEAEGKGEEYRRDVLDKYLNYAQREKDFPLTEFRSRHSPATEAVGYGKTLMLFHMLRRDLGDIVFAQALRRFYDAYRFKRAAFGDLASVFSATAGRDVLPFFEQWTTRTGAPALALGAVACEARGSTYHVRVEVAETQDGPPYSLAVPIAFTLEGRAEPAVHRLALDARTGALEVDLPARPLRVELDPQFDLFRRLDRHEIPSSLGQLFGAAQATFVLPGAQDPVAPAAWRELAQSWLGANTAKGAIVGESELGELPRGRAVWILGSSNRWASALVSHLAAQGARIGSEALALGGTELPRARHAFAVTAPHPGDPEQALAWIGADLREALPGLARKLPHYGKYSYLAFQGSEPSNDAKGQWTAVGSPLVRVLVEDGAAPAQPVRREPLARPEPVFDGARLLEHVRTLAAPELDGRGVGTKGIELAADYIAAQMKAIGLEPGGDDGSYFAAWTESGGPDGGDVTLRNVVGVIRGENAQWRDQSVVLGAHYDHLGRGWPDVREANRGERHPGADDNASGVAVLLEVARALAGHVAPGRALVFAAFSGEEWGLRGSRHYVAHMARWPAARALAMLNLDTVGRLGTSKLIVLGTGSATEWIHIAMGIGFTTGVESTPVNDDLGSSDQKSFLDAGVPAVQLFSGANADYHRPSDTADKIDAPGMIKVATFTREALVYLADRAEPLTATSPAARPDAATAPSSARRVSLGTSPDMTFAGPGIKVAAVIEGSPAAKAGLQANDLILAIDGKDIADLRAYAAVLKAHAPGDTITIRVRRGSTELEIEATLVAR